MNGFKAIEVTIDARGVASVVLNNPARKNALSAAMMDDLTRFATEAGGAGVSEALLAACPACAEHFAAIDGDTVLANWTPGETA